MSDKSNQQISNLMDGELDVNASQFLLKRMAADESLSSTWSSYHLIKSCLQKQTNEPLIVDVAHNVFQQLNNHQPVTVIEKQKTNSWLKPIMGMGIAASVAFMSVVLLQNQQNDRPAVKITEGPSFVQENVALPLKTNISANVATASTTIVPPPSLSRFPSVSAQESINSNANLGFSHNMNVPYLIIINDSQYNTVQQYSPIKVDGVAD